MKIPERELTVLKRAYQKLGDAYRNITCLSSFLTRHNHKESSLAYTIVLIGILRNQELSSILNIPLDDFPVFGKERDMVTKSELRQMVTSIFSTESCYIIGDDYTPKSTDLCIDKSFNLYRTTL